MINDFDRADLKKIRLSALFSFLCFLVPILSGLALPLIFHPDFEMTNNISFYSILVQILCILSIYIFQLLTILIGLRILVRYAGIGERMMYLCLILLVVLLIIAPIQYVLLASRINWSLVGFYTDLELIRLAYLSDTFLLTCYITFSFTLLILALAFTSFLFSLKRKYAIRQLKTAGILYLFQVVYCVAQLLVLTEISSWIISTPYIVAWGLTLFSFGELGVGLLYYSTTELSRDIYPTIIEKPELLEDHITLELKNLGITADGQIKMIIEKIAYSDPKYAKKPVRAWPFREKGKLVLTDKELIFLGKKNTNFTIPISEIGAIQPFSARAGALSFKVCEVTYKEPKISMIFMTFWSEINNLKLLETLQEWYNTGVKEQD